jgi:DNA-directed RNA polymerase specialized sigma54-like protein
MKTSKIALGVRQKYQQVLKREKKAEKDIKYLKNKLKNAKRIHRKIKEKREDLGERAIALASFGY